MSYSKLVHTAIFKIPWLAFHHFHDHWDTGVFDCSLTSSNNIPITKCLFCSCLQTHHNTNYPIILLATTTWDNVWGEVLQKPLCTYTTCRLHTVVTPKLPLHLPPPPIPSLCFRLPQYCPSSYHLPQYHQRPLLRA